jgi:putative holliday junction resolvase
MKYLGIDFGTKRVGLAVSDEDGIVAFPRKIIDAHGAFGTIVDMLASEGIQAIVVGSSLAQSGQPNPIETEIKKFCSDIEAHTGLPVLRQNELFSSIEAIRHHFDVKPIANPRRTGKDIPAHDDSAAAIILQRYLDSQSPMALQTGETLAD